MKSRPVAAGTRPFGPTLRTEPRGPGPPPGEPHPPTPLIE